MTMFYSLVIGLFFSLGEFNVVDTKVTLNEDAVKIQNLVTEVERAVNTADAQKLLDLMAKDAKDSLKEDIIKSLYGKRLEFKLEIDGPSFQEQKNDRVKFKTFSNIKGLDYERIGVENYFVAEKEGEDWRIYETDFQTKLRKKDYFLWFFKVILPYSAISVLSLLIWIYAIVDVLRSEIKNKKMWLLIVVLFNVLGALIYFFVNRKKKKIKKKKY